MDSEKIQEMIKKIRIDNNLTQKELADKLGVTYQAVSKWENGKNLPDISLILQMAKQYNVDLSDMLNIESNNNPNKKKYVVITSIILGVLLIIVLGIINFGYKSYEFKTIKSSCKEFEVSGSLAYDKVKSSIYISDIEYCGNEENKNYKELNCSLYEKNNDNIKEISKCEIKNNISLKEYLKNINFNIENFSKKCGTYNKDSLYLEINAIDDDGVLKTYKIPLVVDSKCDN